MNDSYFFTVKEHPLFSTQSLERADLKVFLTPGFENEERISMQTILYRWLRREEGVAIVPASTSE